MSKKITVPAEETDTFAIEVSFDNGQSCNVTFEYAKDNAMNAIYAIAKIGESEYIGGMLKALRHDPSVQKRLSDVGIGFTDEDDDWDEDYE